MTQQEIDIEFTKSILPKHYIVKPSKRASSIHCTSLIGIRHRVDADDNEHWGYIVASIEKYFGDRFMEIDHNTNFCHVDFTIHIKQPKEKDWENANLSDVKEYLSENIDDMPGYELKKAKLINEIRNKIK